MARYREKDETDLRWNSIRRRITRQLDTEFADVREVILNKLLTKAWDDYSAALETGKKLKIEEQVSNWVEAAILEVTGSKIEALDLEMLNAAEE